MKIIVFVLLILCIVFVAALPIGFEARNRNQQNVLVQNVAQMPAVQQPSVRQTLNIGVEGNDQQENSTSQAVTFYVEPENLTVKNGDFLNVTIMTDLPSDQEMAAAEFHLSWNTSILNGLNIIKVLFQNNSIGWDQLNSSQGTLMCVHSLCSESVTGTQALAIITFQAAAQGSTVLHFTFVAACSSDARKLNCQTLDGNIIVEPGVGATPIVSSGEPANALYKMTITAGSTNNENQILPPATAALNVPFNVNIQIVNVTDMSGWEFGLTWNNTALYCTQVEIYDPPSWQNSITIDGQINNNYTSTQGYYHIALANNGTYTGSITIATLTFQPLLSGTTLLAFNIVDLCDGNANSMSCSAPTGSITVR